MDGFSLFLKLDHYPPDASLDNAPALFHALSIGRDAVIVLAQRLGHAKIDITNDIYAHALPSMQKDAARRFSELLK